MATYVIGDIQGCHYSFLELLQKIKFNKDKDQLHFVGDLVNRGKNSKIFLDWCLANSSSIDSVLGNHDLHFLSVFFGESEQTKLDTLDETLSSKQVEKYVEWLLNRKLAYDIDKTLIVHAGISPNWTIKKTKKIASKVNKSVKKNPNKFFKNMYGNFPLAWSNKLPSSSKKRMAVNIMTRMRMLRDDLSMDYDYKGAIDETLKNNTPAIQPWFDFKRKDADHKIITGHWSAIGVHQHQYGISIDSGCAWGKFLSAIRLSDSKIFQVQANKQDLIA